jgi:hypothetical protein
MSLNGSTTRAMVVEAGERVIGNDLLPSAHDGNEAIVQDLFSWYEMNVDRLLLWW